MRSFLHFGELTPLRMRELSVTRRTQEGLVEETWRVRVELDLLRDDAGAWMQAQGETQALALCDQGGRSLLAFGGSDPARVAKLGDLTLENNNTLLLSFVNSYDPLGEAEEALAATSVVESFTSISERNRTRFVDLVPLSPSAVPIRQITGADEIEIIQESWRRGFADFPEAEEALYPGESIDTQIRYELRDGKHFTHARYLFKPLPEATP